MFCLLENQEGFMIVDSHLHLGYDDIYEREAREEDLLAAANQAGLDIMIIQPAHTHFIEASQELHNRVSQFAKENPGRVFGLASVNPHYGEETYFAEIQRCICELGFVGIKLDTFAHACSPLSKAGSLVFQAADRFRVPVMVHTGLMPFSMPLLLYARAKEFPDVRIIVAHAGEQFLQNEAVLLAKDCPNVFLETSVRDTNSRSIRQLVKELGARRVMNGSGWYTEIEHALWKYRSDHQTRLSKQELTWCLGQTALEVFRLRERIQPADPEMVEGSGI
jgi:uncharacterized protein